MFDVGHGDCILVVDSKGQSLLVDCGALYPKKYFHVPRFIEHVLPNNNTCGLVVSHYHWDHYSLFRWFKHPDTLFSKLYLPHLPMRGPGREATVALMSFMKVAILSNFRHYRILPEVHDFFLGTGRKVTFCDSGVMIHESGLPFRVFWPDLTHFAIRMRKKIVNKARSLRDLIDPIIDHFHISKPVEYGTDYSVERFFDDMRTEELRYRQLNDQLRGEIHQTLAKLESIFRDLANIFSIAFRTHYKRKNRFLFLGDLTESVLNIMTIPGTGKYDCIKTAHHGSEFGSALSGMSTDYLLISRSQKDKRIRRINDGYIFDMRYRMLLSTEFLGDCHIL